MRLLGTILLLICFQTQAAINQRQALQDIDEVLFMQGYALDNVEEKELKQGFKFKEYVTDIGFSKSGLVGLTNTKVFTGVEVKWRKKKSQQFGTYELAPNEFEMEGDFNLPENQAVFESILKLSSKKVGKRKQKRLRRAFKKKLKKLQEKLRNLASTKIKGWKFSGVRLDINFGADGSFWFFAKAGAVFRVRLNWKYNSPNVETIAQKRKKNPAVKILESLDRNLSKVKFPKYDLKKAYVGIGLSHGFTLFSVLSSKLSYIGAAYFDRIKSDVKVVSAKNNKLDKKTIKTLKLASRITKRMEGKSRKWEVHKFKAVFSVSQKGVLNFLKTGANSLVELDFVKGASHEL